jgi:hypothetical protein
LLLLGTFLVVFSLGSWNSSLTLQQARPGFVLLGALYGGWIPLLRRNVPTVYTRGLRSLRSLSVNWRLPPDL